jgi:RimJ/RimL family protein N-acetyltransferase
VIDHVNAIGAEEVFLMTERLTLTVREERARLRKADGVAELFLVATIDERLVGTANFARGRLSKGRHVAQLGIALRRDARGVGLGRAMMEAGIAWADSVGVRKLTLGVFATNRAAISLYRKLGFRTEARLKGQVMLRGALVDELLMVRWLGKPMRRVRRRASVPTA